MKKWGPSGAHHGEILKYLECRGVPGVGGGEKI